MPLPPPFRNRKPVFNLKIQRTKRDARRKGAKPKAPAMVRLFFLYPKKAPPPPLPTLSCSNPPKRHQCRRHSFSKRTAGRKSSRPCSHTYEDPDAYSRRCTGEGRDNPRNRQKGGLFLKRTASSVNERPRPENRCGYCRRQSGQRHKNRRDRYFRPIRSHIGDRKSH